MLFQKSGRESSEEKENKIVAPVKRKAIEKEKFSKKSKKIIENNEKEKEQLEADEESSMVSTSISTSLASPQAFKYSSISSK